jgi:outer membrane usher protein
MDFLNRTHIRSPLRKWAIPVALMSGITSSYSFAETLQFNPDFIENINGAENIDLSHFAIENVRELPGVYRVDIFINETYYDTQNIDFESQDVTGTNGEQEKVLLPCLSYATLDDIGVKLSSFPELDQYSKQTDDKNLSVEDAEHLAAKTGACVPFTKVIPSATAKFDLYQQRLTLSVPHAAMKRNPRGYVNPDRWDDGIAAAFTDYYYSGAHNTSKPRGQASSSSNDQYLNLRSGINLGAWRLRNYSSARDNDDGSHWQSINTYLERGIKSIKSRLNIGDYYTSSDIFDGMQFRGIQLANDNDMLPDSLKGYAPVVRGIASTHAQVSIRQNGYVIYQSYVPPGAFVIDDLYPTSASGNLEVEVKESDGSTQRFLVPFASTPLMLREGRYNYSVTAGKYRSGYNDHEKPTFFQGSLTRGMGLGFSLYGGTQLSKDYKSAALGVGKNMGDLGAVSLDVTHAISKIDAEDRDKKGQSLRFLYGKSFAAWQTDIRLFGYRYSTEDYFTFQESVDLNSGVNSPYSYYNKRSKIQGSITQGLNGYGSIYINASRQDYWQRNGKEELIQLGYNGSTRYFNYGMSYSHSRVTDYDNRDRRFSLSVSMPLDKLVRNSWLSYSMSTQKHGATNHNLGFSGTALEDRNLEYNLQQNYASGGDSREAYGGAVNLNYKGTYGNAGAGYNYSKEARQINYSLQGGVVIHSDGITLSQPLGETFALVKAEGAAGTRVYNNSGIKTDWRGYAVVPYINPYRTSRIELDTSTLAHHVDMLDGAVDITPTRGAVVKADFDTRLGHRALITLSRPNGELIPFGATAVIIDAVSSKNKKYDGMAIVSEENELYISGLPTKGEIKVQWGKNGEQSCMVKFQLPADVVKASASANMPQVISFNASCV